MSEGTRIGEFKDSTEFNTAVSGERNVPADLKPTKIGELSEFEMSLMTDSGAPARNSDSSGSDGTFAEEMERMILDYQDGDIIKGTVRRIEKSGVLVDISHKSDGFIANSEFSFDPEDSPADIIKPGDEVNVLIMKLESKEGYTVLSRRRAEYEMAWNTLSRFSKSKDLVSVRVASKVEGGLVVSYNGIKGFIPASQVTKEAEESLDTFIGKSLEVIVIQVDRKRRKVIFSHKVGKPKMSREDAARLIDGVEIGQVRGGKITSVKDFGVFVDLGGIEGLVHISEISWSRVGHPSEVLRSGQDVQVFVLGVDRENLKISLGMKQLETDPWVNVAEKYQIGQAVTGEVSRVVAFGAFVRLEQNLEGLIHISELSNQHIEKVEDVVKPGDSVKVKIIKLVPEEQRIGLSIKALGRNDDASSQPNSEEN